MNVDKEQGIRYFPIGLFVSVMGFAGVTLAVRHAEGLFNVNNTSSLILLIITSLLFLLNAGMLVYRLINHRGDVLGDFNHPVKMNFFGAISISLLLLAVGYFEINETTSFVIWILGSALQIILTVAILSRLIWQHEFKLVQFNPAWLIPIVGNIIVPIAGTVHVPKDINWMFFSIGILFSIIYFTIFINRMYFHPPLPPMLQPTFFILLAPPAIGFVAYMKLAEGLDAFGYILYGIAFFMLLLLLSQLKRFTSVPFSLTWWAFLFPSAAMTLATVHIYLENGLGFYKWFFVVQLIAIVLLLIYLAYKTVRVVMNGKLLLKG